MYYKSCVLAKNLLQSINNAAILSCNIVYYLRYLTIQNFSIQIHIQRQHYLLKKETVFVTHSTKNRLHSIGHLDLMDPNRIASLSTVLLFAEVFS
ncbi:hypothetical protein XELAEV_18021097mg [Xenopus laevis]|uniref:Uncharacterized protein n=1 Tax=Xenopus laevis TaxID=8355 RepID=A0A974D8W8_XENLA|nr:hypothetical protein XELAEV_18021097mg [Xenopus laevis]